MKGGSIGNDHFRAGYSATFGVIIALVINLIVLIVLESLIGAFGGRHWSMFQVALYFGIYIGVLSLYVSGFMDKLSV